MIERLIHLIGKDISLMLVGNVPHWFGPYELVTVSADDSLFVAVILRGNSGEYLVNLDQIVVVKEG